MMSLLTDESKWGVSNPFSKELKSTEKRYNYVRRYELFF